MKKRWVITMVAFVLAAGTGTHAANWVSGFVPDWNQPNWCGNPVNGWPNGGPNPAVPAWGAWCTPTAAANLLGHWDDVKGSSVADGVAYNGSGVAWPNWPAYQDYQANGGNQRGALSPGAVDDLGWYMDTNGLGDPAHGNPPAGHTGTYYKDVSWGPLGLNTFFADLGQPSFTALTHGLVYSDPQTAVLPNVQAGFQEVRGEIDGNRTAVAHFTHWNLQFFLPGAVQGPLANEADYGFDYYTFTTPSFPAGSDAELGEEWNGQTDGEGLGHSVTVVGYILAGAGDDPLGNTDWVIVHDNWSTTPRNVAVPFAPAWAVNTIVVPEPGVLVLGMGGLVALLARRCRR